MHHRVTEANQPLSGVNPFGDLKMINFNLCRRQAAKNVMGRERDKQWKSIALEMKTWIWLQELRESTRISKDGNPAEVLIELTLLHLHACMMGLRVSEEISANETAHQEHENSFIQARCLQCVIRFPSAVDFHMIFITFVRDGRQTPLEATAKH